MGIVMGKGKEGRQRKHLNTVRKWKRIVEEKEQGVGWGRRALWM